MNERISGLDSMRGIAAFLVYTHHFVLMFYPNFYFGQHNWINHIFNPDLAVSWFFVHSGFVLAYKGRFLTGDYYRTQLLDQALRRYLRLLPPVITSILITYALMKSELIFNQSYGKELNSVWTTQYLNFEAFFGEALKQSFYSIYFSFKSSTTFNPNLWTIGQELIGSYILFAALGLFGWWKKSFIPFLLLAIIIGPWKGIMCFFIGAALTRIPSLKLHPFFLGFLIFTGFLISDLKGSYSSYARNIGAGILMFCLLNLPRLRIWLSSQPLEYLGRISYSLYVMHFSVLMSFTCWLGIKWHAHESLYKVFFLYVLTTFVVVLISHLVWKYIDYPGIKISKRFSMLCLKRN
jgi:peptidoglycan/LPS O-acetylase OafA/YrhL